MFLCSVCMEADVPYSGQYRAAGAAFGMSQGMGILVGSDCRVARTFRGECWECKPCSGCGNWVVVTAQHADVTALACKYPVVCGTGVSMSMDVGSPSSSWYSVAGITQGWCKGDGALIGSWCCIAAVIPGEHLEAVMWTWSMHAGDSHACST